MSVEKITKKLYNGDVKLIFYPVSHRYKLEGEKEWLLSVTSITGLIDKSQVLINWAINLDFDWLQTEIHKYSSSHITEIVALELIEEARRQHTIKKEKAADIGTQIHEFAEMFGKYKLGLNDCPEIPKDALSEVRNGISAFLDWINNNKVDFVKCEKMVYSKEYKYAGLADAIAYVNGELTLIDYKSSSGIYNEMYLQVSAYMYAYNEENKKDQIKDSMILKFGKSDGELEKKEISFSENLKNFEAFKGLLKTKNRLKELNKK